MFSQMIFDHLSQRLASAGEDAAFDRRVNPLNQFVRQTSRYRLGHRRQEYVPITYALRIIGQTISSGREWLATV
jgi:hypothetical protein